MRQHPVRLERVVVRFAGDPGDGMQLTGDRFTSETAVGNDLSTLPKFPAEIRAPADMLPGVSSCQLHFAHHGILTPGDAPDVLAAMNPAALKANLADRPRSAEIIVNTDEFSSVARPVDETLMAGQLATAVADRGPGDLATLLAGNDTRTIPARPTTGIPAPHIEADMIMTLLSPASAPMAVSPTAVLGRFRAMVEPELQAALATLHPDLARMGAYAFGWCDADGAPADGRGGKMLRSALALLSAELVGEQAEKALPGAVGVELLHAFSLIHDDIMDGDEQRRHRPAVWKIYGAGPAILAGDALFALAVRALAQAGQPHTAGEAIRMLTQASVDLCQGQAQDLAFEQRPWTGPKRVTAAEYRAMAAGKTGALIACSLAIGAVLTGSPPGTVRTLLKTGHRLGLAFQIIDDVLSGTGDPRATGKPVLNDLRARKKTLPILTALSAPGPAGAQLRTVLAANDDLADGGLAHLSDEDLARIGDLVAETGGYEQAIGEARRLVQGGLAALSGDRLRVEAVEELGSLAAFLLDRSG